ncbi:hypothetical protein [Clostridium sp.]|jgi:integrase|uniref:hypothetical protein n=1 Tax=Clostridium sp. TaxID=1506 RepID=UPI0039F5E30D
MSREAINYNFNNNSIVQYNYSKKVYKAKKKWINFKINNNTWFSDMVWDFSEMNVNNRQRYKYKFDFNFIPEPFIFYIKVVIFEELNKKKNSYTSTSKLKEHLQRLTKDLYKYNIKDVRLIDKAIIELYIEKKLKNCGNYHVGGLAISIKKLINSIIDINGYNLENIVNYLNKVISSCTKKRSSKSANQYIPDQFLNEVVSLAIKDVDNEKLKLDDRIMACLMILLAETGMRAEEVSLLETNKLDTIVVNGTELCYLKFLTFKSGTRETYTALSDKALKAYRTCENLVKNIIENLSEKTKLRLLITLHTKKDLKRPITLEELRKMISEIDDDRLKELELESTRYLFTSAKTGLQKKGIVPLRENLERFFIRHENDFSIETMPYNQKENLKILKIQSKSKYEKYFSLEKRNHLSFEEVKNKRFYYVNPHMFRVTVCTKLFMQGVHLDFIVKHLNHLSEDMSAYYNKSEDFIDSLEEGTNILSSIANVEGLIETNPDLINNKFLQNEMKNEEFKINIEKINDFLKSSKLNIRDDLGKIIKLLDKTDSSIVENELGICIRSTISGLCERRKYFSSISDSYFLENTLPTYRYIHFSYERFHQKVSIVNHNRKIAEEDESYMLEFEREEKALKIFVRNNLMEQIVLLNKDINKIGQNPILHKYPQIGEVLLNLDNIRKEIGPWME